MATRRTALVLASFALLATYTHASNWVVETNSFRVKEPNDLRGEYDVAIGDFGVPLYGASLDGKLKYVPDNSLGCEPFATDAFSPEGEFIALVQRGDCYFVEKAYNAEKAGAKAILVYDDRDEQLLTMAAPEDRPEIAKLREDITIPTALIPKVRRHFGIPIGIKMKDALAQESVPIIVELDWTESLVHPDDRVEWELWTTTNDGCGNSCDIQLRFKKEFRDTAVQLEKAGNTQFRPHFMSRECTSGLESEECKNGCIHWGRYCAVDSIGDDYLGIYKPWQVVEENKRQLCVYQQAEEAGTPWLWWDFAGGYGTRCTMANGQYNNHECGKAEVEAIGLDNAKVVECMAQSFHDEPHPLLQADFDLQGRDMWGSGKILLLPTVIINTNQYRGRLDTPSVVRALCAGFSESTEPEICLSGGLQTDECALDTHDCWRNGDQNACIDTFRGYVCQCPEGWQGDGHSCEDVDECATGAAQCDQKCVNLPGGFRCECNDGYKLLGSATVAICVPIDQCAENNGGCEQECKSNNRCQDLLLRGGPTFRRRWTHMLDVDECHLGTSGCEQTCENKDPRLTGLTLFDNTTGMQYVCKCNEGFAVSPEDLHKCVKQAFVISPHFHLQTQYLEMVGVTEMLKGNVAGISWMSIGGIIAAATVLAVLGGFAIHKLRMRRLMETEIQSIMRQYMPLEGNNFPEADANLLSNDKIKASFVSHDGAEVC